MRRWRAIASGVPSAPQAVASSTVSFSPTVSGPGLPPVVFTKRFPPRRLNRAFLAELPAHMQSVQSVTREASEAIRGRFFPTQAEPSWIGETS